MKLLVIEDDPEMAAYVAHGLREQGHVVDLAATGRDGLFLASEGDHDVLIADRMLPGLDGIGVVTALRKLKRSVQSLCAGIPPRSATGFD